MEELIELRRQFNMRVLSGVNSDEAMKLALEDVFESDMYYVVKYHYFNPVMVHYDRHVYIIDSGIYKKLEY